MTPKPLFAFDPALQKSQLFNDNQSVGGTPTDVSSFTSIYHTGTQSVFAQPFSRYALVQQVRHIICIYTVG